MLTSKVFYFVIFVLLSSNCVHGNPYPHESDCSLFYQRSHNTVLEFRCQTNPTSAENPTITTMPSTPAPPTCQWLAGQEIAMGTRCNVPQGFFVFQFDGNAVIYNNNQTPLWNTQTAGRGHTFVFQTDGNLVMYSIDRTAVWNGGSHNHGGSLLVFQQDRNLVIYNAATVPLWNSRTNVA